MTFFILIVIFLTVALTVIVPAFRSGARREGWVYAVLAGASFIVLSLNAFGVQLPSPLLPVQRLIERMVEGG